MTILPHLAQRRLVRRVIVVITDGLRPDVIPLLDLPVLGRLVRHGAATLAAQTVAPSVTAAAMASLLTGVRPQRHGLTSDRFGIPRPTGSIDPLPATLREAGVPARAWMAQLPWTFRRLGRTIATRAGFDAVTFSGKHAREILNAATPALNAHTDGLFMLHWPDADVAGHATGWPSPSYLRAARELDRCLERLIDITGVTSDPGGLLIVLADHGGGGLTRRDHDSGHALDRTIPIVLAGGNVRPCQLLPGTSLLDVPPTVLHALGSPVPASYAGRVLNEAFLPEGYAHDRRRSAHVVEDRRKVPLAAAS